MLLQSDSLGDPACRKNAETVDTMETIARSRRWQAFSVSALTVLIVVLDHMRLNRLVKSDFRVVGNSPKHHSREGGNPGSY
jgi:hypothetical protein